MQSVPAEDSLGIAGSLGLNFGCTFGSALAFHSVNKMRPVPAPFRAVALRSDRNVRRRSSPRWQNGNGEQLVFP
jgi:hypothetical protein